MTRSCRSRRSFGDGGKRRNAHHLPAVPKQGYCPLFLGSFQLPRSNPPTSLQKAVKKPVTTRRAKKDQAIHSYLRAAAERRSVSPRRIGRRATIEICPPIQTQAARTWSQRTAWAPFGFHTDPDYTRTGRTMGSFRRNCLRYRSATFRSPGSLSIQRCGSEPGSNGGCRRQRRANDSSRYRRRGVTTTVLHSMEISSDLWCSSREPFGGLPTP